MKEKMDLPSGGLWRPTGIAAPGEEYALVGESPSIERVREMIKRIATSDMTVLIRGETGTGKGLVARLVHQCSQRGRSRPFVNVNCPAIPDTLLESEMFGHEKGAFTGAVSRKLGRFEQAEGGTIFLDEIGHVHPAIQAKLLDVVESKEFVRIGGLERRHFDARIVTATNAPLEKLIMEGAFREDLYYRLCQFVIVVPPLRERPEDIPVLANYFLQKHCERFHVPLRKLTNGYTSKLMAHTWPGNVREVSTLMGQYALCGDSEIFDNLLPQIRTQEVRTQEVRTQEIRPESDSLLPLRENEIELLKRALAKTGFNQRRAAAMLGLSYSAFRRRVAKFGLRECLQHKA
ncbi:MAG: sigma-54 dependent transcriptional regulator [Candidatus Hydrogenedentes bacterium]|nr:sigma-54 dependent transcriptional regulator [Candidatus Hydrogenedentota bacterium]